MSRYTQQQLDELRANIAKGALKVRMADEEVTFRSLAEMQRLAASMEQEIAASAGVARQSRRSYPTVSRGTAA